MKFGIQATYRYVIVKQTLYLILEDGRLQITKYCRIVICYVKFLGRASQTESF